MKIAKNDIIISIGILIWGLLLSLLSALLYALLENY